MTGNKMIMTTVMTVTLRSTYEVARLKQWKLSGLDGVRVWFDPKEYS